MLILLLYNLFFYLIIFPIDSEEEVNVINIPLIKVKKYKTEFSSNICEKNHALISNCIYIQGALSMEISNNIIRENSLPLTSLISQNQIYKNSYFYSKLSVSGKETLFFNPPFTFMRVQPI